MHIINDDDVMLRFDHDDDIFEGQTGQLVNDMLMMTSLPPGTS